MIDRLLELLEDRSVFVLGKGGVGKTTTAGGIALALAERGEAVHLISTDPAHSLADLFGQSIDPGGVEPSACAPDLMLEEYDAAASFRDWRERAGPSVRELLERGTYLDDGDIEDFLDRSLPGVDEFMGALRLARLAGAAPRRLVVDTAPTGHTLRLLDAGRVLESWLGALRAMERKAVAVASHLGRRPVRLSSADFLEELERDALAFRALLREAAGVLVWRPEPLIERETLCLRQELTERGLRIAAELRIELGRDGPGEQGEQDEPRGCDGIRRWGRGRGWSIRRVGSRQAARSSASVRAGSPVVAPAAEVLPGGRERLLFVGKGGVGKTTCAAACAVALSSSCRVALLSTDPSGSLADLLGRRPTRQGLRLNERLVVRQLEPEATFQEFRERSRGHLEAVARGVGLNAALALDREVLDSMIELIPPGLDELIGLALLAEDGDEELLVLDAAPTGHFLRLLETPEVALGWVHSLMRLLLKYKQVTGLGEAAEGLLVLGRRIRRLRRVLTDPRSTGAVPVALAEPMVMAETRRLCERLRTAGVPVAGLLWNRCERETSRQTLGRLGCGTGKLPVLVAPLRYEPIVGLAGAGAFFASWRRVE